MFRKTAHTARLLISASSVVENPERAGAIIFMTILCGKPRAPRASNPRARLQNLSMNPTDNAHKRVILRLRISPVRR
jgi:hypothetical protein